VFHRLTLPALAGVLLLPAVVASAASPERDAAARGASFVLAAQQPDGGFGGFGPGQTMDAVFALRAAGIDLSTVVASSGASPATYLVSVADEAADAPTAGKYALAAVALGLDPSDVDGIDLIEVMQASLDTATGRYAPGNNFGEGIAILGLSCTGNPADARAVAALAEAQDDSGGWGFDADTASIVIQALLSAGLPKSDPVITAGIAHIRERQADDGGWGFDPNASDPSVTAYVIQGLIAAGEDPGSAAYRKPGGTPVDFLLAQQQADGSFSGFDPAFATNLAVPALLGKTYCEAAVAPVTQPAPSVTPSPTVTAPLPPSTGNGYASDGGSSRLPFAAACVALAIASCAVACRSARRG